MILCYIEISRSVDYEEENINDNLCIKSNHIKFSDEME